MPKLRDSWSTNQIVRFVNYYCYGANVIEFSIGLKNWKRSHGIEIRSRDSIVIPLMIVENSASFFTVSLWVPVEQGYRRDTRDSSS